MDPLIELKGVTKHYGVGGVGWFRSSDTQVTAVCSVDLEIRPGQTLALVGESGSGKTTIAKLILLLEDPSGGSVWFDGRPVERRRSRALAEYRSNVQAVFQDPSSSLNPRMTVRDIVTEPARVQGLNRREKREIAEKLLEMVGISRRAIDLYPHQFSGGQRQRIAIARTLSIQPRVIVLDEPVSGLDASVRGQILNLLRKVQDDHGVAYLLISHDLDSVRFMAHDVAVMYSGHVVEHAPVNQILTHPMHPYTRMLLESSLPSHPNQRRSLHLADYQDPHTHADSSSGCVFRARCPEAMNLCGEIPKLLDYGAGHMAACHLARGRVQVEISPSRNPS